MRRTIIPAAAAALLLAAACTSGDDDSTEAEGGGETTTTLDPQEAQRAPGVTDDTIRLGVTYPDLEALGDAVNIDHGDYEAVYQAVIDDVNTNGGVNGRRIEPVYAPVNPRGTQPAEEACLRLTEDEQVFAVAGYLQADEPLCYLETHDTAVIGGQMTPDRLERAAAPWFSPDAGSDLQTDVVEAFAEDGELDEDFAVFAQSTDEGLLRDHVEPQLDELGLEPVDSAVMDADLTDVAAVDAATRTIAERFESAGATKVLVVGDSGVAWLRGLVGTDYRPQTLLVTMNSTRTYANNAAGADLSVLEGAVAGDLYGPPQAEFEEAGMQDCIAVIEEAGIEVPSPEETDEGETNWFESASRACRYIPLFTALAEAAGDDLNYATFRAAADGLDVDIPTRPDPGRYGPPPAADGDFPVYLYDFDADAPGFYVRRDA